MFTHVIRMKKVGKRKVLPASGKSGEAANSAAAMGLALSLRRSFNSTVRRLGAGKQNA